jgi:hypothetical protein
MITIRKLGSFLKKIRFISNEFLLVAAMIILAWPIPCTAQSMAMQECRIVDERGLTLAVERGTQEHFTVVFTFSEGVQGQGQLLLVDVGGSGGMKKGVLDAAGRIQLKEVGPGTWQLIERPKGTMLTSVRIY